MATKFSDFMKEIEEEAKTEGIKALQELSVLKIFYQKVQTSIKEKLGL